MSNQIRLGDIATARSGDKGNHANIGVIALDPQHYSTLVDQLTPELIADFFSHLKVTKVTRYELPKIHALNFVLENVLGGGASQSLRIDTQGKLLGTALLEITLKPL